jgi:hypothetical protein
MSNAVKGYYKSVEIQFSAGEGPQSYQVDAKLADSIVSKASGRRDGRISNQDAADLVQEFRDGGAYGAGEKPLARALLKARDDRNVVTIDGQRIRMPDQAEKTFTKGMQQFWGHLGQEARKSGVSNTQQAVQGFASQQSQQAQQS